MPHKKILILMPIVAILFLICPMVLGDVPADHWFKSNGNIYLVLILVFLLISSIGYWVNRKKTFGPKMVKWHVWTNTIGILLLLFGIFGHYHYDAYALSNNIDPIKFTEGKVKLLAIIFLASALLVIGFCTYMVNLLISNYSKDKGES